MPKPTQPKPGQQKSAKRREGVRRNLPKSAPTLRSLLNRPELINITLVLLVFAVVVAALLVWSREQIKVREGQVMTTARLNRIDFTVRDDAATERAREAKRTSAPRLYRLNTDYLLSLEAALNGLPQAVANKTALDEISQELIAAFGLTDDGLKAIQRMIVEGETTSQWLRHVRRLVHEQLHRHPILESQEFQVYSVTPSDRRSLLLPDGSQATILGEEIELIAGEPEAAETRLRYLVAGAGFASDVEPFILNRLTYEPQPTMMFDEEQTELNREALAAAVEDVLVEHHAGEVIHRPGDVLNAQQYDDLHSESRQFLMRASLSAIWLPRLGILGLVVVLTGFLGLLIVRQYPRIVRNTLRASTICMLLFGMMLLTMTVVAGSPQLLVPTTLASTLFIAVMLTLAYDQRLAILLSAFQAIMLALAINQGIGWFILLSSGCIAMVAMLGEVRHRGALIRASSVTAGVLAIGTILVGLAQMPANGTDEAFRQIGSSAIWATIAAFGVGFLALGILPGLERIFDITTGMTLAELRDPRQPLLRELQQRAPGTYNHSLQVANICEAAAEAIGADGLLMYVGAMYHDIGKMNKPQYFVENQADGLNKHDNLSPAMSLLVIIGHVKDGIELAREYGLPRRLHHFIESHHGTTLVEYFYHAARTQAEQDDKAPPVSEVEFRYPGPRPATREAAILMLADAVESATRAMTEPNPSRIESLVRELAQKRLMDGQFDECGLTFHELGQIQDAIISRVNSIYHGRIAYPTEIKADSDAAADDTSGTGKPDSTKAASA